MKSEWAKVPIESICQGIYDGPHATPAPSDSGAIFLGISNFVNGRLNFSDIRYIAEEDLPKWTKRVTPQAHDIVFSYEATLNLYAIIPEGFRGCLGRRMALMRPDESKVDYRYLYYYMYSPAWRAEIEAHKVMGSTVDRIPLIYFPSFTIELPSMTIQRRIADILSALDDKIELNQRINENLQQQIFSLFHAEYQYPKDNEGWQNGCIGDVVNLQRGYDLPKDKVIDGGYPVAGSTDTIAYHANFTTEPPCIVMGRSGNIGRPRLYLQKCWAHNTTLFSKEYKNSDPYWVYAMLSSIDYGQFQGGTAVPTLNRNHVHAFPIDIPPRTKQKEFGEFASALFGVITQNTEENKKLGLIRDTLLPKLMSGEIDVSGIQL